MSGTATLDRKRTRRNRRILKRGGVVHQSIVEYAAVKASSVDREAGIIHGVKILGCVSKNGRTYSPQAMKDAARLYEGCSVNFNHPARPGEERQVNDRFGRLTNIKVTESGVFGDLEYLKTHPMADRITEAAERMPDQYGLSHNCEAQLERIHGELIVQRIDSVRSVDIVSDAATNTGLFESVNMTTLAQLIESIPAKTCGRTCLMEILGDETIGDIVADEPVAADIVDAGADEQIKAAFDMAAVAVVKDESIPPAETAKKVEMLMVAKEEAVSGTEPTIEQDDDDDPPKDKPVDESHKRTVNARLTQLEERLETQGAELSGVTGERDALAAKSHARGLLESAGRDVNDVHVDALTNMPDDASRKGLIESWPKSSKPIPKPARSVPLMEHDQDEPYPKDAESFAESLAR